jgi:hypothetical protein
LMVGMVVSPGFPSMAGRSMVGTARVCGEESARGHNQAFLTSSAVAGGWVFLLWRCRVMLFLGPGRSGLMLFLGR